MKRFPTLLLGCAVALLVLAPTAHSQTTPNVTEFVAALQSIVEALAFAEVPPDARAAEFLADEDKNPRLNAAYKIMLDKLTQKIPTLTQMHISSLGDAAGALYVSNAVIYGADQTLFGFDAPGSSYDIKNLTIRIPYLDIHAESYTLDNFNLNNMVTLNGHGPLYIRLEGIFLHCELKVKFRSLKFVVEHVPTLEIALSGAELKLWNIGGQGAALEDLLNSIANDMLPYIIEALNNDVQAAINVPGAWATMEPTFNSLFTTILNQLKETLT